MRIFINTDKLTGEKMYGLVRDDGSSLWTPDPKYVPEIEAWLADGNTPEPWEAPNAD
jgi:hypothetical protein